MSNENNSTVDSFMKLMGAQLAERAWKDIYEFGSPEAKQKLADAMLAALPEMMRYGGNAHERVFAMPAVKAAMESFASRVVEHIDGLEAKEFAEGVKEKILAEVKHVVESKLRENMLIYVRK